MGPMSSKTSGRTKKVGPRFLEDSGSCVQYIYIRVNAVMPQGRPKGGLSENRFFQGAANSISGFSKAFFISDVHMV